MNVLTIQAVLAMTPGQTIEAFKGRVETAPGLLSGENAQGKWSIQNCRFSDGAGNQVKVKLCNREPIPTSWVNQWVYIACQPNSKGKLAGVEYIEETYRGQTANIIKVGPSATVEPADQQVPAQQSPTQTQAPESMPPSPAPASGHVQQPAVDPIPFQPRATDFRHTLARWADMYTECRAAAFYVDRVCQERGMPPMTSEQIQGCTGSLFIKADKHGWDSK